jgi:hypothetical protein
LLISAIGKKTSIGLDGRDAPPWLSLLPTDVSRLSKIPKTYHVLKTLLAK